MKITSQKIKGDCILASEDIDVFEGGKINPKIKSITLVMEAGSFVSLVVEEYDDGENLMSGNCHSSSLNIGQGPATVTRKYYVNKVNIETIDAEDMASKIKEQRISNIASISELELLEL